MSGKIARARASKAKKQGEAAGPPAPVPPPPPAPDPAHRPHRSKEKLEHAEAKLDQAEADQTATWRAGHAVHAKEVAELEGTRDFVVREQVVKECLDSAVIRTRRVQGGRDRASVVAACTEMKRRWGVAAHASTAAVTAAAAARAAVAAGVKTHTTLTEVAATAARAAVAAAKEAEAAEYAAYDTLDAVGRAEAATDRRSGSSVGGGGAPTPAAPAAVEMTTERAPPRVTPSPQTVTTKERPTEQAAAAAAAPALISEEAVGVATAEVAKIGELGAHAPDRETLAKRLHTCAKSAKDAIRDDTVG
jgi:hypothetical protein